MDEITTIPALRERLAAARAQGRRIGFVPTMGFLHEGHLALVDDARAHSDCVVTSIFVNPLQFAPGEDFARYPRDLIRDRALAASRDVDLLFVPSAEEMYAAGRDIRVNAGAIGDRWEGGVRPGHFDGVLTVVARLFNLVQPDVACFGQKDIQQVTLIRRMIAQLGFPLTLRVVPTLRDADGLAMSSRNTYLAPDDRARALALSRALRGADAAWAGGERRAARLAAVMESALSAEGLAADYVAIVEPDTLKEVADAPAGTIIALAVRVGSTRLIDNIILGMERA